jgi:hypothetical protein
MIDWHDLTTEVQERWLVYAEIREGRPVTWEEVPTKSERWLEIIQAELQPNRWEDKSVEEKEKLQTDFDMHDKETAQSLREALQIIITDYGVGNTPESPDYRALWLAELRRNRRGADPKLGPPEISNQELYEFARDYLQASEACHDIKPRLRETAVLKELLTTPRWKEMTAKGETAPRKLNALRYRLTKARAIKLIAAMLDGAISPEECGNEIAFQELCVTLLHE